MLSQAPRVRRMPNNGNAAAPPPQQQQHTSSIKADVDFMSPSSSDSFAEHQRYSMPTMPISHPQRKLDFACSSEDEAGGARHSLSPTARPELTGPLLGAAAVEHSAARFMAQHRQAAAGGLVRSPSPVDIDTHATELSEDVDCRVRDDGLVQSRCMDSHESSLISAAGEGVDDGYQPPPPPPHRGPRRAAPLCPPTPSPARPDDKAEHAVESPLPTSTDRPVSSTADGEATANAHKATSQQFAHAACARLSISPSYERDRVVRDGESAEDNNTVTPSVLPSTTLDGDGGYEDGISAGQEEVVTVYSSGAGPLMQSATLDSSANFFSGTRSHTTRWRTDRDAVRRPGSAGGVDGVSATSLGATSNHPIHVRLELDDVLRSAASDSPSPQRPASASASTSQSTSPVLAAGPGGGGNWRLADTPVDDDWSSSSIATERVAEESGESTRYRELQMALENKLSACKRLQAERAQQDTVIAGLRSLATSLHQQLRDALERETEHHERVAALAAALEVAATASQKNPSITNAAAAGECTPSCMWQERHDAVAQELAQVKVALSEQSAVLDRLGLQPPYTEVLLATAQRKVRRLNKVRKAAEASAEVPVSEDGAKHQPSMSPCSDGQRPETSATARTQCEGSVPRQQRQRLALATVSTNAIIIASAKVSPQPQCVAESSSSRSVSLTLADAVRLRRTQQQTAGD